MRRAESHTAPYFGHQGPQDFGIPPEPLRFTKDGTPIEPLNVADKMDALERLYDKWLRRPGSKWRMKLTYEPIRIFREQIYLLMRAYSQAVNELRAVQQQVGQVESNVGVIKKRQELRNFLLTHFEGAVEVADARNTDLTDVCMGLLMDQKQLIEKIAAK